MKLIQINTDHFIIVDDSEIKEGDWIYNAEREPSILKCVGKGSLRGWQKITHSTQPMIQCEDGKGTFDNVNPLSLSEIKELIGEVDVEKKMISPYPINTQNDVDWCNGYQRGYNQALEDNKDKKYTEEDVRKAIEFGHTSYTPFADVHYSNFIQSLQPETEWEVEFVDGKFKLK